jgi:hypothetical protein
MTVPEADIELAERRGLRFEVCLKRIPRGQWTTLVGGLHLRAAVEYAEQQRSHFAEVGVLTQTQRGGFIYWVSSAPDLYNSTVLNEGYA